MGIMKIEFSHEMDTNFTIDRINSTFIDIFINSDIDQDSNEIRNVNLTWNLTSFVNKTLEIQLNFSDPIMISNNVKYDNITFHVINFTDIFLSNEGYVLNEESKNITSKIKKQMF